MSKIHRYALIVLLCAAFTAVLVSPCSAQLRGKALYDKLTTDRTLVNAEGLSRVTWTPCGSAYYYYDAKAKTFLEVNAETGEVSPLFDDAALIEAYNTVSGAEVTVLPFSRFTFLGGCQKIQFLAENLAFIYERATHSIYSYVPEREVVGVRGRSYQEVLSPDLQNRAYTRDFDLYVKDRKENEQALTSGGHSDLRNAFPDWVYPEELGQYDVFWWSPDSKKIAYMQFDEYPVTKYPIVHDVSPEPELELQSYPKAGANNPIVRLFVVDVKSREITQIETGMNTNVYLYRGNWTPDGKYFTWRRLNRWQNQVEVFLSDPETGKSSLLLKDSDPCYIDEGGQLIWLEGGRFLWTSERSGWNEIFLYDMEGKLIKQLTDARLPIGRILGVDEEDGWVYLSGYETRGLESHLYRVKLDGTGFARLTKQAGSHSISLSPNAKFFTDSFSSFDTMRQFTLHRADGTLIRELGTSTVSQEFLDLTLIAPEHFTFKSADGQHDLDGVLYFPAHFDPKQSYPLIMSVYGGPGSRQAVNRYVINGRSQALAQLGFLVASVDHRGVSRRGKKFQNLMYLNMGEIELADHVAAVKHITSRPYADAERVGITGHSYGGYLTCIALLKAPDVFHVGVAGAPVTDWRNYDTIYTERYMRRPQDNPEGYRKGSCMTYAKDLIGHLSIHHGAVDDNVHPGNSIQLLQELLKHNKTFEFMLYPEQQHGIRFSRYADSRVEYFILHLKPEVK
jgi:dipeptidyl-peptidase-4